jgi:hypothetical protein
LGGLAVAQTTKNEPGTLDIGFEQRVRTENWNNILDASNALNDEREQIRYRTRGWMKLPVGTTVDFFVGLNQESNQKLGQPSVFDEVVFESLYLDFKKVFVKGLSLRVGRQNLPHGEGFFLFEGNPGDGSRSIYFNGINLAYEKKKSKLELMGILMPAYDRMLPRINDQHKLLQEWDMASLGAYYTDRNRKNLSWDAYYFYTKETHCKTARSSYQFQPDRHTHSAGARVVRQLDKNWSLTGEFVAQRGMQHGGSEISGWAGYGYVKRTFDTKWKPYVRGGYWAFSGDDPQTKAIEGYDDLFARWPKWSELYIYTQVREQGVAYWTNTKMWEGELGAAPSKHWNGRLTYYKLDGFHPFPKGPQTVFGPGTDRGNMAQCRIDYIHNRNWRAHFLYEGLWSGDFYRARSFGYFVRFEVSYLFTKSMAASWMKR